jgi:hypothetical protein
MSLETEAFLYNWSRRRRRGKAVLLLLGFAIGAAGGALFAVAFGLGIGIGGEGVSLSDEAPPFFRWMNRVFGPWGALFGIAVPAFGALGLYLANFVSGRLENMYDQLIAAGHRPPATAPKVTWLRRMPGLIAITVMLVGPLVLLAVIVRDAMLARGGG